MYYCIIYIYLSKISLAQFQDQSSTVLGLVQYANWILTRAKINFVSIRKRGVKLREGWQPRDEPCLTMLEQLHSICNRTLVYRKQTPVRSPTTSLLSLDSRGDSKVSLFRAGQTGYDILNACTLHVIIHPDEIDHVCVDLHGHKCMVIDDLICFLSHLPWGGQFHPLSTKSHYSSH